MTTATHNIARKAYVAATMAVVALFLLPGAAIAAVGGKDTASSNDITNAAGNGEEMTRLVVGSVIGIVCAIGAVIAFWQRSFRAFGMMFAGLVLAGAFVDGSVLEIASSVQKSLTAK